MTQTQAPLHVVLIDDDKEDYMIVRDFLKDVEGGNYDVEWVSSYERAIERLKEQDADIYFIDYRLGQRTGLELVDEISDNSMKKPMILLTGQGGRDIDVIAMEKGISNFLSKAEISAQLLERAIRYSIRKYRDEERLRETERMRAEKDSAEFANQAKSLFLSHMSHEIRTPLSSILGFTELALDRSLPENERFDFLETIKRNGQHLLELINDILDLSKVEAGQLEIHKNPIVWRCEIEKVLKQIQGIAKNKLISFEFDDGGVQPEMLIVDEQRFRQILLNVIGNAVKFTDKGVIRIKAAFSNDSLLSISVQDTGIGINSEEQSKLFQPFSQCKSSISRNYGGTGLGLNLSRQLARLLGGDLFLQESQPGVGSTFTLTLPGLTERSHVVAETTAQLKEPSLVGVSCPIHKVLLVEDSMDNQDLIRRFLRPSGMEVTTANNGREGVEKASNGQFDVVLMDIQMPEMDGIEATRLLRAQGFKNPIIALTANAMGEERNRAMGSGFSHYLTKPIRREHLMATLRDLCPPPNPNP
jgi:signal transduction histidine kinase